MPTFTIKLAERGTQIKNSECSLTARHMWISLDSDKGKLAV